MTAAKNSSNRNQQCKKWEKDRRDRLKDSFNELAKLLPCYEPSNTISKIDILTKSAEYIIKLQAKATSDDHNQQISKEIKELQVRIGHLTSRNEQLANLLRDANITIPTECGAQLSDKAKKWTGKITPEKAEQITKSQSQKENKKSEANHNKPAACKVRPIKLQEKKKKARRKVKNVKIPPLNTIVTPLSGPSTITITNVQPMQPYYIIANNIASTITTQATTVKNVITTPILSTTNQSNKAFTSGIILPVVQPQTLLNPPLFLNAVNAATPSNTLFVVKTSKSDAPLPNLKPFQSKNSAISKNAAQSSQKLQSQKKLALLRPKRRVIGRIGNKIPIPSSKYDASSFILWPSFNEPQVSVKKRTRIVKRKRKQVDINSIKDADVKKVKKSDVVSVDEVAKKQSSDYSINAICKEPTSKDIEKVINEVVEKANPSNESPNKTSDPTVTASSIPIAPKTFTNNQDQIVKDVQAQKVIIKDVAINQNSLQLQSNQKHFQSKEMNQMLTLPRNQFQNTQTQMLSVNKQQELSTKSIVHVDSSLPQSQTQNQNPTQNQSQNQNQHQIQQIHHNPQTQQILHQHQQELHLHSELSNDIFASLQVQGSQNPESTSPTAAFLNAFPLVSSFTGVKVTEVLEDETTDSPHGTPTLLQIGNLEATQKAAQNAQNNADNLTPSIINLDNFNFFNNNLYSSFDNGLMMATTVTTASANVSVPQATLSTTISTNKTSKVDKVEKVMYNSHQSAATCSNMISTVNSVNSTNMISSANTNELSKPIGSSYRNAAHLPVKKHSLKASSNIHSNVNVEKPFVYNSVGTVGTSVASAPPSSIPQPFYDNTQVNNSSRAVVSSGINFNSTTNRYNEYNTFNPFELPKTTQSFVKSYNEPSYVNNNCNYSYQTGGASDYNYQLGKNNYYDGHGNNCNFYTNNTNNNSNNNLVGQNSTSTNNVTANTNNSGTGATNANKYNNNKKTKDVQTKSMVNWMAPDFASTTAATVAKVTSYSDIAQNSYLNANALYSNEYQNSAGMDTHVQHVQTHQEHQFPWSPTKLPQLLDSSQHFTPSTLPTLVGDLALGIGSYSNPTQAVPVHTQVQVQQVQTFDKKSKQNKKQSHGYEPGNILSVSQLVDHTKDTSQGVATVGTVAAVAGSAGRITNRRNSGTRAAHKSHQVSSKSVAKRHNKDKEKSAKACEVDWDAKRSSSSKNPISNYSAESLIAAKQQNYPKTIPPYMPDNILPYFPHNIDDNFTQNNQTYHQNNTFSANYNNTFMPTSTSTTYLPTSNFIPDMFDNPMENIFSHVNPTKGSNKKSPQKSKDTQYPGVNPAANNLANIGNVTAAKSKNKKKETFVDLSFLSMPSINSPLLPEDFHANFLPPPPNPNQLYSSCKNPINPMYKQSTGELTSILPLASAASTVTPAAGVTGVPGLPGDNVIRTRAIQHPEISPAPGSLTNFNLCTIFPEINRTNSVVPDVFRNYGNNTMATTTTTQKGLNYLPNLE